MLNYILASLVMNQKISLEEADFVSEKLTDKPEPKTVSQALELIDAAVKGYNNQ